MAGLHETLLSRLQKGFDAVESGADPVLRSSNRPGIDFQANGALALAKRLNAKSSDVAADVVDSAELDGIASIVEVAPQGFINLTLEDAFIGASVEALARDDRLGVDALADAKTFVVDYSAPNVAKEMHAGHLRTTIIGDALCRILEFLGQIVVRENHVGDWGTQFGMLIEHLVDVGEDQAAHELSVGDLDDFYRQARAAYDSNPDLQERSRRRVVLLQSGDPETLRLWHVLVDQSVAYFDEVYTKLGVLLTANDIVGESSYNDELAGVVTALDEAGLLVESDGAKCVFPAGYTNREGEPLPLIVQKSDGGFGYAATDLAALRIRFGKQGADTVLYVVGAPQAQHLEMCFAVARQAGWIPQGKEAVHVSFGSVLGKDGKMFKTRAGETVKLVDLLDEAVGRAEAVVRDHVEELGAAESEEIARMVGIGAVKYADLSTDRVKDYTFDWDRMLAFDGNTAPYLQYAHTRCLSILRRAGVEATPASRIVLAEDAERALALALVDFPQVIGSVVETWSPHKLCSYLFGLAGTFTTFYEKCPVLKAEGPDLRDSRLALCGLTAAVLARGLELLGIEAPERM